MWQQRCLLAQADLEAMHPQLFASHAHSHSLAHTRMGLLQGVFARRGANIESLAVGLTVDKALFTIVATGTDATVANLSKQIAKLVNVR